MKTVRFLRRELLQVLILILPFALAAAWWNKLPPVVVTHWGLHGQPDGWMPKVPGLLLPAAFNVVLCLLLAFRPKIDPRLRGNPEASSARYRRVRRIYRYAITGFVAVVAVEVIAFAAGWRFDMRLFCYNGVLAVFAIVGNFMGSLQPGYFVGLRTPWTLQDGDTWRATHRIGGRVMVYGALALLVVQFFVAREAQMLLLITYSVGLAVWSLGYSAWYFQRRRLA